MTSQERVVVSGENAVNQDLEPVPATGQPLWLG